ncbi:4-hydroxy-tetrahydrodipicolinate synthase [bioreactor metagenome]|uniref:4-hydroxy-tetrahydrodipicolinate synthase n=1 Tax=bioreactor metagenome TaxID=1076179 RepID=A0A645GVR9_9ZZZZ
MMSLGAKGVISVAANLVPAVMVQMTHLCLEGNFTEAAKLQLKYMELIDALFVEVNPIPIKTALNLVGINVGSLRLPLCEMAEGTLATLKGAMKRVDLL